jgi:hypothetical protein
MSFLNLSLPELLTLFGAIAGVVVTLYLLDRVRHRHVVCSLRFYNVAGDSPQSRHRRRIRQPWSLLLQLLSLALLLLAAAQVRFGRGSGERRDHILILDTSAWMSAASPRSTTSAHPFRLIAEARAAAWRWIGTLPSTDRVMVVRADALATPVTSFETNRDVLRKAIAESQPGAGTLSVARALEFAAQARSEVSGTGEIVFAGAGRTLRDELPPADNTPALRILRTKGPAEHCGLQRVGVRRSPRDPDVWDVLISAHNYGAIARTAVVQATYGGATVGAAQLRMQPQADQSVTLALSTRAAGQLEVRLTPTDDFSADQQAVLELTARQVAEVAVYTDKPDLLRTVFASIRNVHATFLPTASWNAASPAQIVVLDRFAPAQPPSGDAIWIAPPADRSPVAVRETVENAKLQRWSSAHILGAGLRTHPSLSKTLVFRPSGGDIAIAETDSGPAIVARDGRPKTIVLGFDPLDSEMRYELATPLLFANAVRWMAPLAFRGQELSVASVGSFDVDLGAAVDPSAVTVSGSDGKPVSWTMDGSELRFFTANPGIVHIGTPDRDLIYSLTLPSPGDTIWSPRNAVYGLPARRLPIPPPREIWYWLAILGAAGLIADWLVYARGHRSTPRVPNREAAAPSAWRKAS